MHLRIGLVVAVQIGNQQMAADRVCRTDTKLVAAETAGFENIIFALPNQLDRRFDMAQQCLTLRCQLDIFGTADKKRGAELFFQCFDRLADSGLGNIELAGSFGKT